MDRSMRKAAWAGIATSMLGFVIYLFVHEPHQEPQKIGISKQQFVEMTMKCTAAIRVADCMDQVSRLYVVSE